MLNLHQNHYVALCIEVLHGETNMRDLLLAFALILIPVQGQVESVVDAAHTELAWLAQHTQGELCANSSVPEIRFVPQEVLHLRYFSHTRFVERLNIAGVYDAHLLLLWDGLDWRGSGRHWLVHELVHHCQLLAEERHERHYRCDGEKEAEAVELQQEWAQAHGVRADDIPDVQVFATLCLGFE